MSTSRTLILTEPRPFALGWEDRRIDPPGPGEAVIAVRRAAICGTDLHLVRWTGFAASRYSTPLALGHELIGDIEEVGADVSGFHPGDRIALETHLACGACQQCRSGRGHSCLNLTVFSKLDRGAFAERVVVPAGLLRHVPEGVPDRHGCLLEPLGIAVRAIHDAGVAGRHILIAGCGPIGLLCIAVAQKAGAASVTAIDPEPSRRELASAAGADRVESPGEGTDTNVDCAVDASGSGAAIAGVLSRVRAGGKVVLTGLPDSVVPLDIAGQIILREVSLSGVYGRLLDETWDQARTLIPQLAPALDRIVTHEFPFARAIEAFETATRGDAGKIEVVMFE